MFFAGPSAFSLPEGQDMTSTATVDARRESRKRRTAPARAQDGPAHRHSPTAERPASAPAPFGIGTPRKVRAPRGPERSCKTWQAEAAMRMLMNNLDPEVAERPDQLIVYGGRGQAVRSWPAFDAIVDSLQRLGADETLWSSPASPSASSAPTPTPPASSSPTATSSPPGIRRRTSTAWPPWA